MLTIKTGFKFLRIKNMLQSAYSTYMIQRCSPNNNLLSTIISGLQPNLQRLYSNIPENSPSKRLATEFSQVGPIVIPQDTSRNIKADGKTIRIPYKIKAQNERLKVIVAFCDMKLGKAIKEYLTHCMGESPNCYSTFETDNPKPALLEEEKTYSISIY